MSKAFEPRIGRALAKAMGRYCYGLQLERVRLTRHHAFVLFDVGIKPIHGGVVGMVNKIMVIKKGRKAQWLQNLRKVEKVPRQKKGTPKKEQLGINRSTVLFLDDGTRIKRRMGLITSGS